MSLNLKTYFNSNIVSSLMGAALGGILASITAIYVLKSQNEYDYKKEIHKELTRSYSVVMEKYGDYTRTIAGVQEETNRFYWNKYIGAEAIFELYGKSCTAKEMKNLREELNKYGYEHLTTGHPLFNQKYIVNFQGIYKKKFPKVLKLMKNAVIDSTEVENCVY